MNDHTPSPYFIDENFLLKNDFARILYHQYAKELPIIDYHCHLSPRDIATNRTFENLTQLWLDGDHYKWRAMRTLGIEEKFITGSASDIEKFGEWAYTVPYTVRNPLYHWTHLELKRYFQIEKLLTPKTAEEIFASAGQQLNNSSNTARGLLSRMNVETICTTDDPIDSLEYHQKLRSDKFNIKVLPTFRPDKAFNCDDPERYNSYIDKLSIATKILINDFNSLIEALANRIDFFHSQGCRLSDHGIEHFYYAEKDVTFNCDELFNRLRHNKKLEPKESSYFKYKILLELCRQYHQKKWVQQFHIGAMRNNNSRMMKSLGADSGFDSIGDFAQGLSMAKFLNELDSTDQLSKTNIYSINPADNELMSTMIGNFNDGSSKGKIQFGSAWWFLDQKDGIEKQINALSNASLLSCFVGMVTDSRSFMSFPRHEYFRRILCNMIGQDVENGELPRDEEWLGKIVSDICYHNAKGYFGF